MRRNRLVFSVALFALGVLFTASSPNASTRPGAVLSLYRFTPTNEATLKQIGSRFEITHRDGESFDVYIPVEKASDFLKLAPNATLLEADTGAALRKMTRAQLRGYHDLNSIQAELRRIAFANPTIARLEQYGTSQEGRPLMALKISDDVDLNDSEPELMITSATHGDELMPVEVLMGLMNELVDGYNNHDARITKMVENHEIFFIPVVNPDGYVNRERYANGVDPNRNYPWPQVATVNSNKCIKAIIDFFHKNDIKGSMDFHAFGRLIMYPWAYTSQKVDSVDDKIFYDLTKKMAAANRYTYGQISKVIYIAEGSSADYYYWKNKTIALGIEIGDNKVPSSSTIPAHVTQMREATWTFIEHF